MVPPNSCSVSVRLRAAVLVAACANPAGIAAGGGGGGADGDFGLLNRAPIFFTPDQRSLGLSDPANGSMCTRSSRTRPTNVSNTTKAPSKTRPILTPKQTAQPKPAKGQVTPARKVAALGCAVLGQTGTNGDSGQLLIGSPAGSSDRHAGSRFLRRVLGPARAPRARLRPWGCSRTRGLTGCGWSG